MFGRGISVLRIGFSVVFNALGLLAILAAAWMMPTMLDLMVRVTNFS